MQGREDVIWIRSSLVVLRLVHPQHPPISIHQQGRRDGQGLRCDRRRRARVDAFVAEAEAVGHLELAVREHRGAESVLAVSLGELVRGVRADRQDPNATLVEFGPEFFPSP